MQTIKALIAKINWLRLVQNCENFLSITLFSLMVGRHRLSFHQTVIEFIKPRTSFTGNKFWDKVFDTVSFRRSLNIATLQKGDSFEVFFHIIWLVPKYVVICFQVPFNSSLLRRTCGWILDAVFCPSPQLCHVCANVWFSRSCKSKGSTRLCRCKFDKLKNPPEFQDKSEWFLQQKITWIQTSLMGMTWLLFEFLNDLSWT